MYTFVNRFNHKLSVNSPSAPNQSTRLLSSLTACLAQCRPYLILFLLGCRLVGQAQDTMPPDRLNTTMTSNGRVDIAALTTADLIVVNNGVRRYITNAKLSHQGVLLFSDQAVHESGTSILSGSGHVLLVQGDTITIQADSMQYDAATRQATLLGRVLFQDRRTLLTTPRLDYTLSAHTFCYAGQSRFTDDKHTITSEGGCYDVRTGRPTARPDATVGGAIPPGRTDTLRRNPTVQVAQPVRAADELKPAKINKPANQPVVLATNPVAAPGPPVSMSTTPGKTVVATGPAANGLTARLPQANAKPSREAASQPRPATIPATESELERTLNRRPRPSTVSNFY